MSSQRNVITLGQGYFAVQEDTSSWQGLCHIYSSVRDGGICHGLNSSAGLKWGQKPTFVCARSQLASEKFCTKLLYRKHLICFLQKRSEIGTGLIFRHGTPTSFLLFLASCVSLRTRLPSPLPQGNLPPRSQHRHPRCHRRGLGHIQTHTNLLEEPCIWHRRSSPTSHCSRAPPSVLIPMQSRAPRTGHGTAPEYFGCPASKLGLKKGLGPS